jgi:putative endonuclease
MFYVYVLKSGRDGKFYIGHTADLRKRFDEHNQGKVESTRCLIPFELIYYEACRCVADAVHRERYLKSTYGHRYLKNRLKYDLGNQLFHGAERI